jgi:hypothetical protein
MSEQQEKVQSTSEVMNEVFASLLGGDEATETEVVEESSVDDDSGDREGVQPPGGEDSGEVEGEAKEEAGEAEEEGVSPGSMSAPQHWPKEDREMFATLPEESQKFLLKSYKGMEADYTRKSQGVADIRRALDPVRHIMKKFNISDAVAMQNLVGTYMELIDNPVKGIKKVMGAYNLELDDLSTYWEEPDRFAEESGRKVESLERRLEEQQTKEQQREYKRYLEFVNHWAEGKEFFDQVEQDVADLVVAARNRGEEINREKLDQLYDKACWAVPEIRDKLLEQSKTKDLVESVEDRKKKVAKAKSASKSIKPTATTDKAKEPEPPRTTEEAMDQVWSELSSKGVA